MKRNSLSDRYCPLARSGEQLVDGWTLIIVRDLLSGHKKFKDLEEQTGMSPRSLTIRLNSLVDDEIIAKVKSADGGKRHEYKLTQKGRDLWPVIMTLKHWGEKWNGPWENDEPPVTVTHKGHECHAEISCSCCHEPIDMFSVESRLNEGFLKDRTHMAKLYAELSVNFPAIELERTTGARIAITNRNSPGMLSNILTLIGDSDINVIDLLNKSRGDIAYNLIDLESEPDDGLMAKLRGIDGVINTRHIEPPQCV